MLKGIPTIISPELLKILDEMGHTDEITIADGNFPGHTYGKKVIRLDGHGVPEILDAILQLMPLDTYPNAKGEVDPPCTLMAVEPGDDAKTPIWDEYKDIVKKYDDRGADCFQESINGISTNRRRRNPPVLSCPRRRRSTRISF